MSSLDLRIQKLEERLNNPIVGEMWLGVPLAGFTHEAWIDMLDDDEEQSTEPAKQGTASV